MYVCICHAISDQDVRDAQASGASRLAEVFNHFGVEPACGRCCGAMGEMMRPCSRRKANGGCAGHGHDHHHAHEHGAATPSLLPGLSPALA